MRLPLFAFALALAAGAPCFAEAADMAPRNAPSPVRDLDEPDPPGVTTADPAARRELACFLFKSSAGNAEHVRTAYDMMRSAARLGDPEAPLYLAKFLRADFMIPKDDIAAENYLTSYLGHLLENVDTAFDRLEQLRTVREKMVSNVCGPASTISVTDLANAAPPPGLSSIPQTRWNVLSATGFLAAPPGPKAERFRTEASAQSSAAATRLRACALYKGASGDPNLLLGAYIYMRTAADCGDDLAALYASAYLRMGVGAERSENLANAFLRRIMKRPANRIPPEFDAVAALTDGECAPRDEDGAIKAQRVRLTPAR